MHARIENGVVVEYPVVDIRSRFPNLILPSDLSDDSKLPEGYANVEVVPPQHFDSLLQSCQQGTPVLNPQGKWEQSWTITAKYQTPEDEQAAISLHLSGIKIAMWDSIKQERERRIQLGGYSVDGKWYHSDTFSRSQQLGLVIMGANIPQGLMWKTMNGSFVEMTPVLAQAIFLAAAQSDSAVFTHAENLNQQVQASTSPDSIDIRTGWPVNYLDLVLP